MKICATIAEYNPFHLGHLKHIEYMKNTLNADKVIVFMSGNFTQRGEPAVLDKFSRAKHAIIAGADMVIELPTVFATANAEIFAKGAIKLISSIGAIDGVCFGIESGKKEEYIALASALNDESKEFKRALKDKLDSGVSLAKAKYLAVKELNGDIYNENIMATPNNILGLEYVKALLKEKSQIDFFPMVRDGNHNDKELKKGVTSATSIRSAIKTDKMKKIKSCVPKFVYADLKGYPFVFDKMIMSALVTTPAEKIASVLDCTEGLENRIKALEKDNRSVLALIEKATTKRYTSSRISRILISNLLGISKKTVESALSDGTYLKVLAVASDSKELISLISENSTLPVLTRKSDVVKLKKTALDCFNIDVVANDLYNLATDDNKNENYMIIV